MNIGDKMLKLIFRIYRWLFISSVQVSGKENLIDGPKILVANHPNATDCCVLPNIFLDDLTFLIQADIFSLPVIGSLLRKSGQIPVIRGQGKVALDTALERLSKGSTIVIFPEGKLNHGKKLHRAGFGAAMLAKQSGAPILPIGFYVSSGDTLILKGKIHNRKTFSRWQFRGCCHVHIGKSWKVSTLGEEDLVRLKLREITKRIMNQIRDLVQEAYAEAENEQYLMSPQITQIGH